MRIFCIGRSIYLCILSTGCQKRHQEKREKEFFHRRKLGIIGDYRPHVDGAGGCVGTGVGVGVTGGTAVPGVTPGVVIGALGGGVTGGCTGGVTGGRGVSGVGVGGCTGGGASGGGVGVPGVFPGPVSGAFGASHLPPTQSPKLRMCPCGIPTTVP